MGHESPVTAMRRIPTPTRGRRDRAGDAATPPPATAAEGAIAAWCALSCAGVGSVGTNVLARALGAETTSAPVSASVATTHLYTSHLLFSEPWTHLAR